MIARTLGIHACTVKRLLEQRSIHPTFDPAWLGSLIYRQSDVAGFMAEAVTAYTPEKISGNHAVSDWKAPDFDENGRFGESDDAVCESDVSYCWLGHVGPYINQLLTYQIVFFMVVCTRRPHGAVVKPLQKRLICRAAGEARWRSQPGRARDGFTFKG